MSKKNISISTNYEEIDDAIWNAVMEYTHELYGNDGHIQYVHDGESLVYIPSRASDCMKEKKKKDK